MLAGVGGGTEPLGLFDQFGFAFHATLPALSADFGSAPHAVSVDAAWRVGAMFDLPLQVTDDTANSNAPTW